MNPDLTKGAICGEFGISYQAHNQMRLRQKQRAEVEAKVVEKVQEIRQELPRAGARKLHYLMSDFYQAEGIPMGRDRLFDLLRARNMLVQPKRKGTRTTFPGGVRSENLLDSATITGPNQAWVVDITYIATEAGYRYLALVTDLYSRRIMGWDLSDSLSLEGALRAMQRALAQVKGPVKGLIHHSDHGVQYTSREYLALLRQHGIRPSMGAVGNAYDNAVAERVNGILKLEFMLDQRFPDDATAYRAVANAIHLYNTKRPHLSLKYATPEQAYRRGLRQSEAPAPIAEPLPSGPELSRGEGGFGLRLAQPLTAYGRRIDWPVGDGASASNSSYGKVPPSS